MNYNKYLPMGSVVILKNGTHRVMIIGFCTVTDDKSNVVYDYTGCLYPEGLININQVFAFNHSDINKVFAIGFSDNEEKEFKIKLEKLTKKILDEDGKLKGSREDLEKEKI